MELTHTEAFYFKWKNHRFQSSTLKTEEFLRFAREFKRAISYELPENMTISFMVGHFYISGFFKNETTQKYAYFSISDVRFFQDSWVNDVLIRTAKDDKDYSGGKNQSVYLVNLVKRAKEITE